MNEKHLNEDCKYIKSLITSPKEGGYNIKTFAWAINDCKGKALSLNRNNIERELKHLKEKYNIYDVEISTSYVKPFLSGYRGVRFYEITFKGLDI